MYREFKLLIQLFCIGYLVATTYGWVESGKKARGQVQPPEAQQVPQVTTPVKRPTHECN